jgi:superfamily I DNA/RNA helicase
VSVFAHFLTPGAARHFPAAPLPYGSCAVLCASRRAAKRIAVQLSEQHLPAYFMERDELDLERSGVKVMTLHAAKGLEFPIVMLAGFFDGRMVKASKERQAEAEAEWLARNRRTVFVGMTRAMRSLAVIVLGAYACRSARRL